MSPRKAAAPRSPDGRSAATGGSSGATGRSSRSAGKRGTARRPASRAAKKREFEDYSIVDPSEIPEEPDVLLDVPVAKVDEIDIEVDELRAQVAVLAEVRDLVQLSVGADIHLGKVKLKIEGVEAQALLKARLGNVTAILERVLTTLDRNPELLKSVGQVTERVGGGAGQAVGDTGQAVEGIGKGVEETVEGVGSGAGRATQQVGRGARRATRRLTEGG
jgi:hypothetical protein